MYFSFIIPCYNEEYDIANTIKACVGQDFEGDYEILLVDDGSKDNTLEVINEYSKKYSKIKALSYKENRGVSFARNYGIKNAQGEVLIFLNADEIPHRNFLTQIKKYYEHGADYFFPQTEVMNKSFGYGLFREAYRKYKYSFPNSILWSQGFSCKKILLEKINGFNTCYPGCGGEDWDLVTRIEELSNNRVVDLSIVVQHKVPNGINSVIWHMYNRGRGCAYFDLIRRKINPANSLFKICLNILVLILFCVVFGKVFIGLGLAYLLYCHLAQSYKMAKKINMQNKWYTIAIMGFLDKILRFWGYYRTMLKYLTTQNNIGKGKADLNAS